MLDATHGTNKYNFKLACFTTVSPSGQTVILACTMLASEDTDSYAWALRCFMEVFRLPPVALFTDSDYALRQAFLLCSAEQEVLAGCQHFLCTYHLSKNVYKHLARLFLGDQKAWHAVHSAH